MNPFVLGPGGLAQPWRLWTCHLVHFGAGHALLDLAALAVPFALLPARGRPALGLGLAFLAPLLSLLLLPGLDGGTYRGASGLACATWAMAGPALFRRDRLLGASLLGLLAAKLGLEAVRGAAILAGGPGWTSLPAAHAWGALLGLLASPLLRLPGAGRPSRTPTHRSAPGPAGAAARAADPYPGRLPAGQGEPGQPQGHPDAAREDPREGTAPGRR